MKHAAGMQSAPYSIHTSYLIFCDDCGAVGWAIAEHLRPSREHRMTVIGSFSPETGTLVHPDGSSLKDLPEHGK